MRAATEAERAWMAGFMDGEGCFTITKQIRKGRPSPAYRVQVNVSNTDVRGLQLFIECYGGTFYEVQESRGDRRGLKWADAYVWHCCDGVLERFINDLRPYLRMKGEQADLVMEFHKNKDGFARKGKVGQRFGSAPLSAAEVEYREGLRERVRLLNHKGRLARQRMLESA